jgi:hypothetical protein
MHIYNKIHVLSLTLSYMFRRLLRHPQGDLCFYEELQVQEVNEISNA